MSDNAVEILFKTRAELAGARALEDQLLRQIGQAKALGKNYDELSEKLQKVQASIKSSPTPAGPGMGEMFTKIKEGLGDVVPGFAKLDGLLSKFGGGALGAIGGGFGAIATGLELAKKSLDKFSDAEQHVAHLDAALAQSGQLTGEYRQHLQELGSELHELTGVATNEWLGALTRLTQFGADSSNIEQYADAVKDLAGLLHGDVQESAILVSRALQGNFEAFSRLGIVIDQTGTPAERLAHLFKELADRGGGQLESSTKTLAGGMERASDAVGGLLKNFGRLIAETGLVQTVLQGIADGVGYYADKLKGTIPLVDGLGNAVVKTTQKMDEAARAEKFKESLERLKIAAEQADLKLQGLEASAAAWHQTQEEIANAQKDRKIAEIDSQVAAGTVTKFEGDQKKGQIESDAIQDSAKRQKEFLREQNRLAAARMNTADVAAHVAEGNVEREQARSADASKREQVNNQAAKDAEALRQAEEERAAIKKKLESPEFSNASVFGRGLLAAPYGTLAAAAKFKEREELQKRGARLDDMLPGLRSVAETSGAKVTDIAGQDASLATLKQQAKEARDKADATRIEYENKARVFKAQGTAVDAATPERLKAQQSRTNVELIHDQGEEKKTLEENLNKELREASLGLGRGAHSYLGEAARSIHEGTDATVKGFETLAGVAADHEAQVKNIVQQIANLTNRVSNLRTPP